MGKAIATGVVACTLLASANAHAFCRTTTEPPRPTLAIPDGAECAPREGLPLFHRSRCFSYQLTAERPDLPNSVLSEQVARAFAAWTTPNATCTPGITALELPADTSVAFGRGDVAPTPRSRIGWMTIWNDGPQGEDWFARTNLTFDATTGEILDADIAIKAVFSLGRGQDAEVLAELQSLLLHEVGHVFGFSHSSRANTALYDTVAEPDLRTISADDGAGMCAVYPTRSERLAGAGLVPSDACQLTQGRPSGGCGAPELVHGCSAAPVSSRRWESSLLSVATLAAALGARGARRRPKGLVWFPSWCRRRRGFRSSSDPRCGSRGG